MRQLSGREKALLILGGVALVLFVYLFGLLLPTLDTAARLARAEASVNEKVATAARMYGKRSQIEQEIYALRTQTAELMLSTADVRVAVMRKIDALASAYGVSVTSVRPDEPEPMSGFVKYPTTIEIESDFAHLVRLLYELEQPANRLWVEEVKISSGRGKTDELRATLQVAVYAPRTEREEGDAEA